MLRASGAFTWTDKPQGTWKHLSLLHAPMPLQIICQSSFAHELATHTEHCTTRGLPRTRRRTHFCIFDIAFTSHIAAHAAWACGGDRAAWHAMHCALDRCCIYTGRSHSNRQTRPPNGFHAPRPDMLLRLQQRNYHTEDNATLNPRMNKHHTACTPTTLHALPMLRV